MKKSNVFLLLLALISAFSLAQVYRWVDEKGGIHFGDKPPEEGDAEQLVLPEGPSEAESARAQEDLRKRPQMRAIPDEALESGSADVEDPALEKAEPKAGIEAIRNEELACFTPLSAFVEGDSAKHFSPITPTELTGKQQTLLKDLFGSIGRYWRGQITDVACTGNTSEPDSKSLEFEVKTTFDWNARESLLVVETDSSGKNDRSVEELAHRYKVGDALYIRAGKVLSEGFSNIAVKGNRVEIISLEGNTLVFLIKRHAKPARWNTEIRYLEFTRSQLFFKELYFANDDTLTGWRTWALRN